MAKELVYRVRIDYDSSEARKGGQVISESQEEAEQATNQTTAALRRQQEAQEQASQTTRGYNKAQSNANQTLFTFGDLLNDSQQFQFGFAQGTRAIGNNIGFAAEQFSQINRRTGSWRASLKALGSSLLGPGGIILAINAAVTAITVFGDQLFDTTEKTKAFNVELKESNEFLQELTEQKVGDFVDQFESTGRQLEAVNDAIDNLVGTLPEGVDLMSQLEDITRSNKQEFEETGRILDDTIAPLEEQDRSLNEIEQATLKILKNKRAELRAQQEIDRALRNTLTSAAGQVQITSEQIARMSDFVRQLRELGTRDMGIAGLGEGGIFGTPSDLEREAERRKQIRIEKEKEAFAQIGMTRKEGLEKFKQYYVEDVQNKEETEQAKTAIERLEQNQRRQAAMTAIQSTQDAIGVLFQNSKAASIASAVINAGAAIVRQFKDLPIYAAIPSAIATAAKTAQQISKMKQVQPGSAGNVNAPSGSSASEGFQTTQLPSRSQTIDQGIQQPQSQQPINVTLQTEADNRVISAKAEQGRKQRERGVNVITSDTVQV